MSSAADSVLSPDGTRIAFRRVGSGPPVLAIHGGLGSADSWRPVAERLADRFEVVLYDRRGRGASGPGTEPHSLAREVEDARAVLALAEEPAAVVGHSFGGTVALELARVVPPGEVRRLVLYEPAVGVAGAVPAEVVDRMQQLIDEGEAERSLALGFDALESAGMVRSAGPPHERPAAARAALSRVAWTVPRELRAVAGLGDDPARSSAVDVPVLLLAGDESPRPMRSACEALARALPDARLELLPGVGHVAHAVAPELVAERVGAFLG